MNLTKRCSKCGETKPLDEFYSHENKKDRKRPDCKECVKERSRKYFQKHREERIGHNKKYYENGGREKQGIKSMYENKLCSAYLGVVIGERLCRHLFKDVEVMPHGNTGYDIICNKGKKIDVKTACTTLINGFPCWKFNIDYNKITDFFILITFDNRTDLNPLHIWMIPGKEINHKSSKSIRPSTIHKWDKWKRDIKDAQICCTEMKKEK